MLPASSFQLPASSFQLPASSFQLPASSFQLPASSFQRLPSPVSRLPSPVSLFPHSTACAEPLTLNAQQGRLRPFSIVVDTFCTAAYNSRPLISGGNELLHIKLGVW